MKGDGQLTMQRLGLGGRLVGWRVHGVIKAAFNDAWQREPANRKKYDQENQPAEASRAFDCFIS